jgi:hypothetical protein
MPQLIPTKFNFKARTIKDENGKEIGKSKKQPALEANLPQPTIEEVVAILMSDDEAHAKVKAYVMDSIYSGVRDQAKAQLDEYIDSMDPNEDKTVTADVLDYDKLDIVYIANLPPAQRGARAIPEEDWEAFFQDYLQVMVSVTGKPEAKIKNHLEHFKKPTRIKQAKEILAVLVEQLDVYMASSSNIEETGECSARVRGKFAKWLEEDTKFDVSAL